jgi:hypothetical protein
MEREDTGANLLLAEPEIVAWLGLTKKRDDVPPPAWRDRALGRRSDALRLDPHVTRAVRTPQFGIVL